MNMKSDKAAADFRAGEKRAAARSNEIFACAKNGEIETTPQTPDAQTKPDRQNVGTENGCGVLQRFFAQAKKHLGIA